MFLDGVAKSNTDYFWRGGIKENLLPEVLEMLGNSDSQLGVCLPGNIGCNGTCLLDQEKQLKFEASDGQIYCTDNCGEIRKLSHTRFFIFLHTYTLRRDLLNIVLCLWAGIFLLNT